MATDKGPGPYLNSVPKEGNDPIMQTVDFNSNAIGANAAGMPDGTRGNKLTLPHVGGSVGGATGSSNRGN